MHKDYGLKRSSMDRGVNAPVRPHFSIFHLRPTTQKRPEGPSWRLVWPYRARQSQMIRMLPESTCPSFQMQRPISSSIPGRTRS